MFFFSSRDRRRKKLLAQPFPAIWAEHLARNVGHVRFLPKALRQRLEESTRIIVAERTFVGCGGLALTDEMRVTIAAQASLLLLGVEGYYFEQVPSILVYPSPYVRPHQVGGLVHEEATLFGESWQRGSIVLSWPETLAGGRNPRDGRNLVLHEFAHHLDALDGEAGGMPPLPDGASRRHWQEVMQEEFRRHQQRVDRGQPTLLDAYGAESPAEFFAVATECFFERPRPLVREHADCYAALRGFYQCDPAEWLPEAAEASPGALPAGAAEIDAAILAATSEAEGDAADAEAEDALTPADLPPLRTADEHFARGHEYFLDGAWELALHDFEIVLDHNPADDEARELRAETLWRLGRFEEAEADSRRVLAGRARHPEAWRVLGLALVAQEKYAEGIAALDKALSRASDAEAFFERGLARFHLGQLALATQDFTEAIRLDPDDAEAWQLRSLCRRELGQTAEADRDWAKALRLDPTLAEGEIEAGEEEGDGEAS